MPIPMASESEMMAQFLCTYHSPSEQDHNDPSFSLPLMSWSSDTAAYSCYGSLENGKSSSNLHHWSQGDDMAPVMNYCMEGDQILDPSIWVTPLSPFCHPTCVYDETSNEDIGEPVAPQYQILQPKRKYCKYKDDISSQSSKKAQVSTDIAKSMKRSTGSSDEEDSNTTMNCMNSCSHISEDPTALQDLNGRKRSNIEPSNNPQSLYARKRRERINERLRILQSLVPNGTKVDISTMLEEAVHYVKFLQLQIKLLSSDELWMYAPIAYNGINIGLDLKISPLQQQ